MIISSSVQIRWIILSFGSSNGDGPARCTAPPVRAPPRIPCGKDTWNGEHIGGTSTLW